MIVTIVHIWVIKEYIDEFIRTTIENHELSVKEPGNFRFDFLQDDSDPSKFVLYEAYISEADVAEHKHTPYYVKWRDKVAPWMMKPREGIKHKVIKPTEKELW